MKYIKLIIFWVCLIAAIISITQISYGMDKQNTYAVTFEIKYVNPMRYIKVINEFQKVDKFHPPIKHGILFIGSSSIRMWNLKKWFPKLNATNRGFGGSQISDVLFFFDTVVKPFSPKVIVFYCGDNDIAYGKRPQRVFNQFVLFAHRVHRLWPKTNIIYIPIKPSIARWNLINNNHLVNNKILVYSKAHKYIIYATTASGMLDKKGEPNKTLFRKDGLHLSNKGYKLWSDIVRPLIKLGKS